MQESDPDAELTAWQEAQIPTPDEQELRGLAHRCPIDVAPCPECQQKDDDDYAEG
jgi:hypothetical protein